MQGTNAKSEHSSQNNENWQEKFQHALQTQPYVWKSHKTKNHIPVHAGHCAWYVITSIMKQNMLKPHPSTLHVAL